MSTLRAMSESYAFAEHGVTSKDGLQLYCREYGAAHTRERRPAVLCLPGLTRNSRDFERLASALADQYRVLSPDFRGRGKSAWDPHPTNYQPMQYANDLLVMLEALGVARVVAIGTSLGGLVAMVLAALRPSVLAGVVLNDVGPEIDPRGAARIANNVLNIPPVTNWDQAAAQAKLVNGAALPDFDDADWMRFARATYRDDAHGRPVRDMDPQVGAALRNASAAAVDLWPLFAALRPIPTLAIRGALSDILSEATFAKMLAQKPDMQTVSITNRGHAPTLDEPQARAAIWGFLALHAREPDGS